ncbi:M28 family metallopeptidase [Sphingomonas edaphi]|uniref:M20/M25/M40 family metallo-hydrolase n=1 Tax=Sphingomonas edaphi TaxID=2315689 RepID=A0A418Q472_9SPHN|nr:M28 family metallopeptidase [Sphingomonas edaphi]RIX32707.1 M20/M25/M40 family metallo-hydrolase [Sphingomonas edaphi]
MKIVALPLLSLALVAAAPPGSISPERLSADTKVLASYEFEGRAPGTRGEQKTIAWLTTELQKIGLEPAGPGGKWTQDVPLVNTQLGQGNFSADRTPLAFGKDVYASTVRPVDRVTIDRAPMVFVGYGVSAPERGWDDFKGVDLKGKVAVILVNDPDFEAATGDGSVDKFGGRRMTYYGRWTYKYEEVARRGAVAALIVHDTPGAGYGWETVNASQGENYDIADATGRLALQGWLHGDAARRLFADSGLDLGALRKASRQADFKPAELKQHFSADVPVSVKRVMSSNVLAKLPGATVPDEYVMYGAHWDAYGVGAPDARGRTIRPGANDDALGVAGLLDIARAFKRGPRPDRSILFGFWTAEERGLVGSEAYAMNPVAPAAKVAANITLDILNTAGPARDVMLVGEGQNSLEDELANAARAQGRMVTPEALPERGLFYRADHFPMAKRGIPTLLLMAISGAPNLVKGGREAGAKWLEGFMKCYHQTCDEWSPALDFDAAAADVSLAYEVGRSVSRAGVWPTWSEGSEFRSVREQPRPGERGK